MLKKYSEKPAIELSDRMADDYVSERDRTMRRNQPDRYFSQRFSTIRQDRLDKDTAYVLFIGDPKFRMTTPLLTQKLSDIYGGKKVEIINVVANMPPQYMLDTPGMQHVVVNSKLAALDKHMNTRGCMYPLEQGELNRDASNNQEVLRLTRALLDHQGEIYINVFRHTPSLTLPDMARDRIHVIGPRPELYEHFDDKVLQREIAEDLGIPLPEGYVADSFEQLLQIYEERFCNERHDGKAFVNCARGAGGSGTQVVRNIEDILGSSNIRKSMKKGNADKFLISELLDLEASPCTLGIVANPDEVLVTSVADQLMMGTNYGGTVYPSDECSGLVDQMIKYTKMIGSEISRRGYDVAGTDYRGFFGADFLIAKDAEGRPKVFFGEINPRKIGSTPEVVLADRTMFPGRASLPELELMATTQGTFGVDVSGHKLPEMTWGVRNLKAKRGQRTINHVARSRSEVDVFRESGVTLLDHPSYMTYLGEGRLARAVAAINGQVGERPREDVIRMLQEETSKVKLGKAPWITEMVSHAA